MNRKLLKLTRQKSSVLAQSRHRVFWKCISLVSILIFGIEIIIRILAGEDYAGMIQLRSVLLEAFKAAYVWQANTIVRAGGSRLINDKLEGIHIIQRLTLKNMYLLLRISGYGLWYRADQARSWTAVVYCFLRKARLHNVGSTFCKLLFSKAGEKEIEIFKSKVNLWFVWTSVMCVCVNVEHIYFISVNVV